MNYRFFLATAIIMSASFSFASDDKTPPPTTTTTINGTVGLTFVSGVTDTQTYNLLGSWDRATKGFDSVHVDAGYFFSRQTTATSSQYEVASNFAFVNGRYDRNVSEKLAVYGSVGYREDNPNNLSLRSIYGGGMSYNVHDGKSWKWNLSAGAAYLTEKYTDGTSELQTPSAAFGSQYNRNISGNMSVSHTLSYLPQFSNFSDYLLTSVFSFGYQITKPLKLTINNVVDYQSNPPAGSLMKNNQWFIGLTFGGKSG